MIDGEGKYFWLLYVGIQTVSSQSSLASYSMHMLGNFWRLGRKDTYRRLWVTTVWPHSCVRLINCEFIQWDSGSHVSFFCFSWHHCKWLDFSDVPCASVFAWILEVTKALASSALRVLGDETTNACEQRLSSVHHVWTMHSILEIHIFSTYVYWPLAYLIDWFQLICCVLKPCVNLN